MSQSASATEIREAYRTKARVLHPDRHGDGSAAEQRTAARRMQDVNEAWRVLGDPAGRRRYDRSLGASEPARTWTAHAEDPPFELVSDGTARLVRALPWLLLVVALIVIFVFTAYAGTGRSPETTLQPGQISDRLGDCVNVASGPVTTVVPCDQPNDGQVVAEVGVSEICPPDTRALRLAAEHVTVCLASDAGTATTSTAAG